MPNMKIYVDDGLLRDWHPALAAALNPIRDCIMRRLQVTRPACQIIILPAIGLPDQALINVEFQILPHPDRTRPLIEATGEEVLEIIQTATGCRPVFRCVQHDADSYVLLK